MRQGGLGAADPGELCASFQRWSYVARPDAPWSEQPVGLQYQGSRLQIRQAVRSGRTAGLAVKPEALARPMLAVALHDRRGLARSEPSLAHRIAGASMNPTTAEPGQAMERRSNVAQSGSNAAKFRCTCQLVAVTGPGATDRGQPPKWSYTAW